MKDYLARELFDALRGLLSFPQPWCAGTVEEAGKRNPSGGQF